MSLGQLGSARRRFFYGPGINNFEMTLTKVTRITESKSLEFRLEGFNVFNHAQFYGPGTVDGDVMIRTLERSAERRAATGPACHEAYVLSPAAALVFRVAL